MSSELFTDERLAEKQCRGESSLHQQARLWHGRRGLQLQLDVCRQLPHDILHRRVWNQHERCSHPDAYIPILGCYQRPNHRRTHRQDPYSLGTIPPMAALRSPYHGTGADTHFLGTPRMEPDRQDHLHGSDLLHPGTGLYLRQPALWHSLRSHDTGYRREPNSTPAAR